MVSLKKTLSEISAINNEINNITLALQKTLCLNEGITIRHWDFKYPYLKILARWSDRELNKTSATKTLFS